MTIHWEYLPIPLPLKHEDFRNDQTLIRRAQRLADLCELFGDCDAARRYLKVSACSKDINVREPVAIAAVVTICKVFTESHGRLKLEPKKVFSDAILNGEWWLIDHFRNKIICHQVVEANRAKVNLLVVNGEIKFADTNGVIETSRYPVDQRNIFTALSKVVDAVEEYLKEKKAEAGESLVANLTPAQHKYLTETDKATLCSLHSKDHVQSSGNPLFTTRTPVNR